MKRKLKLWLLGKLGFQYFVSKDTGVVFAYESNRASNLILVRITTLPVSILYHIKIELLK